MNKTPKTVEEAHTTYQAGDHGQATQKSVQQEQYVIDHKGKKVGVILSLKRYQQIMEDLHDLAVVAERRGERAVSLEEMKRRLREDGLL